MWITYKDPESCVSYLEYKNKSKGYIIGKLMSYMEIEFNEAYELYFKHKKTNKK